MTIRVASARISILATLALGITGCSSIEKAYNSSVDTLSGWLKADEPKEQKKEEKK